MTNLLIGGSGLIGSFLMEKLPFDELVNSQDYPKRKKYSMAICAAPSANKWQANLNPDKDVDSVLELIKKLNNIQCSKFFLISTIDVYEDVSNSDENSSTNSKVPYGANRRLLDKYVRSRFHNYSIFRLAGIVDEKIKKNPIYDIANGVNLDSNSTSSVMQFIPLGEILKAMDIATKFEIKTLNLCSEPITLSEIQSFSSNIFRGNTIQHYNVKSSVLNEIYGKKYSNSKSEVLELIQQYILNRAP